MADQSPDVSDGTGPGRRTTRNGVSARLRRVSPAAGSPAEAKSPTEGLASSKPTKSKSNARAVPGNLVDLVVLACRPRVHTCRVLGTDRQVALKAAGRSAVPGAILSVLPSSPWDPSAQAFPLGSVVSMRFDAAALGLKPLELHDEGEWDPRECVTEDEVSVEDWFAPILAHGKRPMFEMQQPVPAVDDFEDGLDPISEANDLMESGLLGGAREILMGLLEKDLRCLDAHALLGNLEFDARPAKALQHYEVGVSLGELAPGFHARCVLPWGLVNNRPFLRCLHGKGLCLWRKRDFRGARAVFERMLWLNPWDNQGARFVLADVEAKQPWTDDEDTE